MRARHGNIWHGTDPPDLGTARHGTSLYYDAATFASLAISVCLVKGLQIATDVSLVVKFFMCGSLVLFSFKFDSSSCSYDFVDIHTGTSRAVPCQDLVDPCRAKYFRAVPS